MEFPGLGARCADPECRQMDFLPLRCACGLLLCRLHHACHALACAACEPARDLLPGPAPTPALRCTSPGCARADLHEMRCPKCHRHFCIEHRFHPECPEVDDETLAAKREEIAAPRRQFEQSNVPLQLKITENIRRALQSSAKVKTASKIHLMRIKQKAAGLKSVPVPDRVYFSITKPLNTSAKSIFTINAENFTPIESMNIDPDVKDSVPVFISKEWTLGRAIDNICDTCHISNENNKPGSNKVRVFRQIDGYCVGSVGMDTGVSELISKEVLVEGDKLVVEYIGEEELAAVSEVAQIFLKLPIESKINKNVQGIITQM